MKDQYSNKHTDTEKHTDRQRQKPTYWKDRERLTDICTQRNIHNVGMSLIDWQVYIQTKQQSER